ncbi:MAG: phenylacetic acid degradation operon negative regulatory protein [Parcubacteria group bacterium Gr01-1014_33]|nr:MAG: phenylacetic acid degradation operon negative regulatory protein [Parcubacteria group bacterium Gr01-1014_33]
MQKKTKERKLRIALQTHDEFLIKRLGAEWDEIQRKATHAAIVEFAKTSSLVMAKTILILLAIVGTATSAGIAPNIFAAVGGISRRRVFFQKKEIMRAQNYLKKRKFIEVQTKDNTRELSLTKEGYKNVLVSAFRELKINRPATWDKIWRVIIFDIPDKKKWARDTLRKSLREMGFLQLQKSAFVSPYPCEEEAEYLTGLLDIVGHVRLIRTQEIIHDDDIRTSFSL